MAEEAMTVPAEALAEWRTWIGRTEVRRERLDVEALRRFAAALGEAPDVERAFPPLGHWAFFVPVAARGATGADGHPLRGGFLPPVTLPRRMFAAGSFRFHAPLTLDTSAERRSTVRDVAHRSGRSGELVLVEVEHEVVQDGATCIEERQTLIYRAAGAPTPPVVAANPPPAGEAWTPTTIDLFRFSAVTFNAHRIHYDAPYATAVEGYPALVVHGPLAAARLFGVAARGGGRAAAFAFRAEAPLFVDQPIALADDGAGAVRAIRCDGTTAMRATIEFGDG